VSHDTITCANYTVLVLFVVIFVVVGRYRRICSSLTCVHTFKYVFVNMYRIQRRLTDVPRKLKKVKNVSQIDVGFK
jgi:hypothetical protein